jgi:hypothetical protein
MERKSTNTQATLLAQLFIKKINPNNMKYFFTIFIIIFCTSSTILKTDKYYVTFVKGKVVLALTEKQLKVGDVLSPDDRLVFIEKTAKVSCINPTKGRFDINPNTIKAKSSELFTILIASLVPSVSTYKLSTRSIIFDGNDPYNYFASPETQNRILIVEQKPILIKSTVKMDESNFFFIQVIEEGKLQTRKIQQNGQQLIFSKSIFTNDSSNFEEFVSICYQTNENGKSKSSVIAEFIPILATSKEIADQVNLIKSVSLQKDTKKLKSDIINHIFVNYGKIGAEELSIFTGF